VRAIPRDIVDDIILVDDASTDTTCAIAYKLRLTSYTHEKNKGYGANQKTCYVAALAANADIVVMVHPDFQYDPTVIPELVAPLAYNKTDAVFGSRMLIPKNALRGGMPLWKYIANKFLTAIENAVLSLSLSEYHSGFRAYTKNTLRTVSFTLNSDGFVFDTEIIVQMKCARLTIQEIPIATRYFPEASMIGFLKSSHYGLCILRTLFRYLLHIAHIKISKQFLPLYHL
jgi:glycosyltransferase involved in cell wall biosynthesis